MTVRQFTEHAKKRTPVALLFSVLSKFRLIEAEFLLSPARLQIKSVSADIENGLVRREKIFANNPAQRMAEAGLQVRNIGEVHHVSAEILNAESEPGQSSAGYPRTLSQGEINAVALPTEKPG